MSKTTLVSLTLAGILMSGTAMAEGRGSDRFDELDRNNDGRVTQSEVEAKIAEDFTAADVDGNGTLDQEEAEAFHMERREARHERRRERRGGRMFERRAGDDGVIDRDEFGERGMHRFERADLDQNGEITETEMAIVANLMELRGGRHGRHHVRHHRGD